MAEGFGLAIGAGLVGGVVRYFETARRVITAAALIALAVTLI